MSEIVFWVVILNLLLSNGLLVLSIAKPHLRFWPPPDDRSSWRYQFTRVNGVLGPLMVVGVLALGYLDWDSSAVSHSSRFLVGGALFVCGGGFALWGYFGLGVRASQGQQEGLVANGAYRYSRNPQYVGTIVCFLGYAIACNSAYAFIAWLLWTAWFVMAPFAEEPWLREQLGASYDEYAATVPRFIAFRRVRGSRAA